MRHKKIIIGVCITAIILIGLLLYALYPNEVQMFDSVTFGKKVSTPYGEELNIQLNIGGSAQKGSWFKASISDSASNDLYDVSGTVNGASFSGVADSKSITISVTVDISGNLVTNVKIETLYIKAVDVADSSSKKYYSVESTSPLSVTLPYSNTFYPLNNYGIATMLTDAGASTSNAEIKFYIYIKVSATGSKSGQTLVAEITETEFADLTFTYQTESTSSTVTPNVSVSSWLDIGAQIFVNVASAVLSFAIIVFIFRKRGSK